MNKSLLEELEIHPTRVRYKGKSRILEEDEKKFVVKRNSHSLENIYRYLSSRNFNNYPQVLASMRDGTEVYDYVPDMGVDSAQRLDDMIYLLTVLHNKTTFYKELDLDEIKKKYEEMVDEFQYLFNYYQSVERMIEEEVYMSPSNYYFVLNITLVYDVLNYGKKAIDEWYQLIQNKKTLRFVLNHNYLEKDHLREGTNLYFINWSRADFGFPENDLVDFWKRNYDSLDLLSLLSVYQSKYRLLDYEYNYFLAHICLLKRIDFNKAEEEKIKDVIHLVKYLEKLTDFLLKQNAKKAKEEHHEYTK